MPERTPFAHRDTPPAMASKPRAAAARRRTPARTRLTPDERERLIARGAVAFFCEVGFGGQTRELAKRLGDHAAAAVPLLSQQRSADRPRLSGSVSEPLGPALGRAARRPLAPGARPRDRVLPRVRQGGAQLRVDPHLHVLRAARDEPQQPVSHAGARPYLHARDPRSAPGVRAAITGRRSRSARWSSSWCGRCTRASSTSASASGSTGWRFRRTSTTSWPTSRRRSSTACRPSSRKRSTAKPARKAAGTAKGTNARSRRG